MGMVGKRTIGIKTFDFTNSLDVGVFLMVNNQIQQGQWLKKANLGLRLFTPSTIDDISLYAKLFGIYSGDDRGIAIFNKT